MSHYRLPEALPVEFLARINKQNECWIWTGAKDRGGYGRFYFSGRRHYCHAFVYEILKLRLALEYLKNKCGDRACCNPDHWTALPKDAPWSRTNRRGDREAAGPRPGTLAGQVIVSAPVSLGDRIRALNLSGGTAPLEALLGYSGKFEAYNYCVPREIRLEQNGIFLQEKVCLIVVYPMFLFQQRECFVLRYTYPFREFESVEVRVEKCLGKADQLAREEFRRADRAVWLSQMAASATLIGHARQLQRVIGREGGKDDFMTVK